MRRPTYRVNELARISGVSVRTLHHYDAIGLLVPSARSESGYRLYDEASVFRLQQILIGRELGLSLEAIRRSLDDPAFDRRTVLLDQRRQLERRADDAARMLRAIDVAIEALDAVEARNEGGATPPITEGEERTMSIDLKQIFDGFDHEQYADEVQARWGDTSAYKESARRARSYSKADWEQIKAEQDAIHRDAAAALAAGAAPDDLAVMEIAERHRLVIDRWFYPCSAAMHVDLAAMWEADERFAQNIDRYGAGLTPFLAEAVRANAARRRA